MRLTSAQAEFIRQKAQALFGASARVQLFGSRVDDGARGGDIDLYVEVDQVLPNRASAASRFAAELQLGLGEQHIDVVLVDAQTPPQAIHEVARRQGVAL